MKTLGLEIPSWVTRRRAVLAGGAVAVVAAAELAASRLGDSRLRAIRGINTDRARDIGDGFFEVDGWILTSEDLRRLGGAPEARSE